jgi:HK97 family phage portal protein
MAISHEDFFGRPLEGAARPVSHDAAASLAPVFSAVRLISETIASLPVGVVQAQADGTRARVQHPVNALLDEPNGCMTSFEFFETVVSQQELRGNSYIEIVRQDDRPKALWPLQAGIVTPERLGGGVVYHVRTKGGVVDVGGERVLHLKFATLSRDGILGCDPVALLKADLGAAIGARDYASEYFSNGASPSGVLTHPGALGDKASESLRKQFKNRNCGKNQHSVLILEEGMGWAQVGTDGEKSQLLGTRVFSVQDVARIWRVPAHFLGDTSRSTFSNAATEAESLVKNSLRPRICRLEQALDRALLSPDERASGLSIKFQIDALLRGSTKERYETYSLGIRDGWLSRAEIRSLEDRPPVDGLDKFVLLPGMAQANNDAGQPGAETSSNE